MRALSLNEIIFWGDVVPVVWVYSEKNISVIYPWRANHNKMNFITARSNVLALTIFSVLLLFVQTNLACLAAESVGTSRSPVLPMEEERLIEGATICSRRFGADEINRLTKAGLKIGNDSKSRCLMLKEGNVLFNGGAKVTVVTPSNIIIVGPKASVFIMVTKEDISVLDFSQPKTSEVSVMISASKQVINMQPGKLLVVTDKNVSDLAKMQVSCNLIPFRDVQDVTLGCNFPKAYMANFSVTEALMVIEPLRRMALSHRKNDNVAMEKLVSSAIALGHFKDEE